MDSLDYILENREYISKFGIALDTNNVAAKKKIFEVLCELCDHNADGYARTIETLEFYQKHKNERYRFKIVINELEKATDVEYRVGLLQFINCIIISATSLEERVRIRNEFIGLKVLPLLSELRKAAQGVSDIIEQLDLFDERRECDEAQSLQGGSNGINLNSHLDVFYAILRQVADTPQEVPFLSILQHLLRIDPKEPVSDVIWDTTEKLVHRATLLENHEDSERLLRSSLQKKFACAHCRSNDATSPNRRTSAAPNSPLVNGSGSGPTASAAPPPPPPPIPPPVPPPPMSANGAPPPPPPPLLPLGAGPPPPPGAPPAPLTGGGLPVMAPGSRSEAHKKLLPQQDTPEPTTKMKTLNWGMIPAHVVLGGDNIWTQVASKHGQSAVAVIDWREMEGLFCLQTSGGGSSAQGSPKLGADVPDNKPKLTEITLLDGKRSLKVNIFLKQFRTCNDDIIQLVQRGAHSEIGAEKLRGLLQILPEMDELNLLKSFDGDRARLGSAEKFLLQLMQVSSFKLRIESMLLQQEFAANIEYLEPCISAMIYAGDELMNNKTLQDVLYMVVMAGNFLNWGGYAGNAVGVRLASLQKLTDIRANKPGMNLIHFVAMQAEKRDPDLIKFTAELSTLENASKATSEQISNEIAALDVRIRTVKRQVELPTTDADIKEQMLAFLEAAEREVAVLQAGMKEVEAMRLKLADFFCEDPRTFRLEECFKTFQNFCSKFSQAAKDNEKRQRCEAQERKRKKLREEQLAKRAKQFSAEAEQQQLSLDSSFPDLRASPAPTRRRNGSIHAAFGGKSPDLTPNSSFRQAKVTSGEDELLEYLRSSSEHEHISRDRKAYGSLDRSWARNARSGSASRRRPDLLSFEFERERANSPAPIIAAASEAKSSPATPSSGGVSPAASTHASEDATKPRISREWRQKIETWLQSNENDEKQNEEYKRKRRLVQQNRRSLENDAESERKLDTLPEEEKSVPTTPLPATVGQHQQLPLRNSPTATALANQSEHYQRVYADWKSPAADPPTLLSAPPHTTTTTAEELREYRRQRSAEQTERNAHTLNAIAEEDRRKQLIQELAGPAQKPEHLKLYLRRPLQRSAEQTPTEEGRARQSPQATSKQANATALSTTHSESISATASDRAAAQHEERHERHASGKEIDADNIETPPVTRRVFAGPNTTIVVVNNSSPAANGGDCAPQTRTAGAAAESDDVEPGHFDRYSSTRRTRRYKRGGNDDAPPPKDVREPQSELPAAAVVKAASSESVQLTSPPLAAAATATTTSCVAAAASVTTSASEARSPIARKTIIKLGRHISSINQEDVQEAIRNLKSPLDAPERLWSPPRDLRAQTELPTAASACSNNNNKQSTCNSLKLSHHELNDEGFEETQSLVSDTPSHSKDSTNSSCNEASNEPPSKQPPVQLTAAVKSATAAKSIATRVTAPPPPSSSKLADRLQISKLALSLPPRTQQQLPPRRQTPALGGTLERPRLQRLGSVPYPGEQQQHHAAAAAQRRSNSMRRPAYDVAANGTAGAGAHAAKSRRSGDVERSSSRNSLRSSRSSINSAASAQTVVRRLPGSVGGGGAKPAPHHTVSVDSSPSKRPLAAQNIVPSGRQSAAPTRYRGAGSAANSSAGGVPASRSSSSGSSVSQNVVNMRRAAAANNRADAAGGRSGGGRSGGGLTGAASLGSTSFKENQQQQTPTRTSVARSAVLAAKTQQTAMQQQQQQHGALRSNGFMRPTASSTTKRNK